MCMQKMQASFCIEAHFPVIKDLFSYFWSQLPIHIEMQERAAEHCFDTNFKMMDESSIRHI